MKVRQLSFSHSELVSIRVYYVLERALLSIGLNLNVQQEPRVSRYHVEHFQGRAPHANELISARGGHVPPIRRHSDGHCTSIMTIRLTS